MTPGEGRSGLLVGTSSEDKNVRAKNSSGIANLSHINVMRARCQESGGFLFFSKPELNSKTPGPGSVLFA